MSSVFGIGQSGLSVASLSLATSANNVANVNTDGFVPSRVEAHEVQAGGVTGEVVKDAPAFEAKLDRAILAPSGTDLENEVVSQMAGVQVYRANLASLKASDEMTGALFHLQG